MNSIIFCLQEGNPLLLPCEAAGSMDIEREDGHEVFVSFYMLIAVVRVLHYPGSIGNFSSTRTPVLKQMLPCNESPK